jgi:hypothetical protein
MLHRYVVKMQVAVPDPQFEHSPVHWAVADFALAIANRSTDTFVAPTALPQLSALAHCGIGVMVGEHEVAWCVDGNAHDGYKLVFDENADGDLTDDAPRALAVGPDGNEVVDVDHRFLIRAHHNPALLRWNPLYVRTGILDVDGRQLTVRIRGWFGRYPIQVDRFPAIEVEGYDVHDDRVEIWDHRHLYIAVDVDGERVTFTSRSGP